MRNAKVLTGVIVLLLFVITGLTITGPQEKTLGVNVRIVYLHGAWVWTALVVFTAAGLVGIIGLVTRKEEFHKWSRTFGRIGQFFWITYLPLSIWAMQTNWNGLFLAEPRWRMAVIFAIGGILIQIGITFLENPVWASVGNLIYITLLGIAIMNIPDVMHPSSPILESDATRIQLFFFSLLAATLLMAGALAGLLRNYEGRFR
ncbi:MAG: hypothetical protein ACK2U3_01210 [Anaerolineales bacterium]|jgi:hypothetical protein